MPHRPPPSRRSRLSRPLVVVALLATSLATTLGAAGAVETPASTVFVNEIHYDNASTDTGEFIEIAGPAGADLSGWTIELYNGSNLAPYGSTIDLSTMVIDDEGDGAGAVAIDFPANGIQNGDPDGLALIDNGTVVQFLSYEGTFTAVGGTADGLTSTDIGVDEPSNTPIGDSLQLIGTGETAGDFTWTGPVAASPGSVNTDQTLTGDGGGGGGDDEPAVLISQYVEGSSNNKAIEIANRGTAAVDLTTITVENYNNGAASANGSFTPDAGTLAPGDVYVIANASANATISSVADATSSVTFFNGDDALVVRVDGEIVDMFGTVGSDPGSAWTGGGISTVNQTLCRKDAIAIGNPVGFTDPSVEYDGFAIDVTDGLGSADCTTPIAPLSPCVTAADEDGVVFIHDIQGDGATTPCEGDTVTAAGIVTSLFERDDAPDGFFLQEEDADVDADPATSEGLFVFCREDCPAVVPGDLVSVTGEATDFFGMTQISAAFGSGTFVVESSDNPLPTPVDTTLPAGGATDAEATFEATEGMLVRFPETLVVSEYFEIARYGQIILTPTERPYQFTHTNTPDEVAYDAFTAELATRQIILDDDNNDQNEAISDGPDEGYYQAGGPLTTTDVVRGGDTIDGLTAVMHWSFAGQSGTDAWRLRPVLDSFDYTFTADNPRTATPADVGGRVQVASFNVLNYFTTIDDGSNSGCGPDGTLGCRGADSVAELDRQRAKIVSAITEMGADVVGVIEIENNTSAAMEDLVAALNAAEGSGSYDFVDTGTIGTDAIKVGLIYRPAVVAPTGDHVILDSSVDPAFDDTKNRPMLTQSFEETATGAVFTVAVNHLKSKGSGCGAGDDAVDGSGNCDGTRTRAAEAIVAHLASDPTGSGDPDVLLIGDLNSYRMEAPIAALAAGGFTDLIEANSGPGAYTYVFDSQLGYLDYAMANASLTPQVSGVTEWHVNADEVNVYDYNDDVLDPGEQSFERISESETIFAPDAFRSSDHDPVIVGLELTVPEPPEPSYACGTATYTQSELEAEGYRVLIGTTSSEVLIGTAGKDAILALGGDDLIAALAGDDLVCAGDGNDAVWAGSGDDTIVAGAGSDFVFAGRGNDAIDGGAGFDVGFGERGNDTCVAVEWAVSCRRARRD